MLAAPDDDNARLGFLGALASAELFLLLDGPAEGGRIQPAIFLTEAGPVALAFDTPARLVAAARGTAEHASISGRRLAALLSEGAEPVALGINIGAGGPETIADVATLAWLARLVPPPPAAEARVLGFAPPTGLTPPQLAVLDRATALMRGRARAAYLARAARADGSEGLILTVAGAVPGAEVALAAMVAEVVALSGIDGLAVDVAFRDPVPEALARVALRFDVPPAGPARPDPATPPRLR